MTIETISREDLLLEALERPELRIAEVLPEPYWRKAHIPRAIALPLDDLEARALAAFPDRTTPIVLYCWDHECLNAHVAVPRLRALGYTDLRVYPGGKVEWSEGGLPLVRHSEVRAAV